MPTYFLYARKSTDVEDKQVRSIDGGKLIYLVDTQKIVSLKFPIPLRGRSV